MTASAVGRWAGIATEGIKPLKRERILLGVLTELCHCSNPKGLSYPGVQHIGGEWGFANESVENALQKLSELDYIRCHLTNDSMGSGYRFVYQVNPHSILYIREGLIDEVCALWEQGKTYNVIRSLMKHIQPDGQTEEEPETKPKEEPEEQPQRTPSKRVYNGLSQPPATKKGKTDQPKTGATSNKNNGKAVTQTHANEHNATHANGVTDSEAIIQKNPPPLRVPPPFDDPLLVGDDELMAQKLHDVGSGTKIARARELVWQYGAGLIQAGIEQSESKAKKSRIGWIVDGLKKGYIEYDPLANDPRMQLVDEHGYFYSTREQSPELIAWRDSIDWSARNGKN